VRFEKLIQPFVNDDSLETVHNGRDYAIAKDSDADRDGTTIYNHLINSFTLIDEGKQ
jgi:hypothetical protein